ncbi:hypothetical protein [Noviherbaspirillum galbum]|uniref:Uncharacterized protein n=1 Tax=Noviherbaspirillum galbum TaxID=2709383 RepID=A0A6B3ST10_9BURK|nr:hypothetical protein [Noviherbaspirillum galbum]NEX63903.1 hypothetical protein [Noviherbaspirillum galbum]
MKTARSLHIAIVAAVAALTAAAAVSAIHPQAAPADCATAAVDASLPRVVITAKRLTPMEKLADLVSEKMGRLLS